MSGPTFIPIVPGGISQTIADGLYIRLDGTSVTTASIPFAQGIFIPDSKFASFGNTSGSPDLNIYSDGTNTFITSYNQAALTIQSASGSSGDTDGQWLNLMGGIQSGDGNSRGVRTGNTVDASVSLAGNTTIPNKADFGVGGAFKASGALNEFVGWVGFDSRVYLVSNTLAGSPAAGLLEFNSDDLYFTITTGAARKNFVFADAALTSGRIPFETTNGRLTDSSAFLFSTSTGLTLTDLNIVLSTSTGTQLGTGSTQKLGFWGATPTTRPAAATDILTALSNIGLRGVGATAALATSGAVALSGTFGSSGVSSFTLTTDSTSNSTGGVKLSGGLGVAKSIYAGGDIACDVAGKGFKVKEGSNAKMGTGTLSGGTATISTTAVTASSRIFVTDTGTSLTNVGALQVPTSGITAGTSFIVNSTNILDSSTFIWIIFEPS